MEGKAGPTSTAPAVDSGKRYDQLDRLREYLAKRLRCEAAMVTAGAASALTLGTAACMTLANKSAPHDMPTDVTGSNKTSRIRMLQD
jgi:hypothetical protein